MNTVEEKRQADELARLRTLNTQLGERLEERAGVVESLRAELGELRQSLAHASARITGTAPASCSGCERARREAAQARRERDRARQGEAKALKDVRRLEAVEDLAGIKAKAKERDVFEARADKARRALRERDEELERCRARLRIAAHDLEALRVENAQLKMLERVEPAEAPKPGEVCDVRPGNMWQDLGTMATRLRTTLTAVDRMSSGEVDNWAWLERRSIEITRGIYMDEVRIAPGARVRTGTRGDVTDDAHRVLIRKR